MESLINDLIPSDSDSSHFAGMTLSVVKGGQIFIQGYGFVDVVKQIQVGTENAIIRNGSISKLFTTTAVKHLANCHLMGMDGCQPVPERL